MDGQVLGGGVIVAVSVLLWLVYLVPSWYERRQYDAAERNAVRLNQALRVLAETSETPDEVRLELNTVRRSERLPSASVSRSLQLPNASTLPWSRRARNSLRPDRSPRLVALVPVAAHGC